MKHDGKTNSRIPAFCAAIAVYRDSSPSPSVLLIPFSLSTWRQEIPYGDLWYVVGIVAAILIFVSGVPEVLKDPWMVFAFMILGHLSRAQTGGIMHCEKHGSMSGECRCRNKSFRSCERQTAYVFDRAIAEESG